MTAYFIRRLLLTIPTFIGITLLVFAITRLVPGGPIERMMVEAQMANQEMGSLSQNNIGGAALSEDQLAELNAYYGFDKPILESYFHWLKKVVMLDLGQSTRYSEPVWETIKERLPVSLFYGISSIIITYLICIPLGIAKAIHHNSIFDNVSSMIVFVGYAIPGYIVGIGLISVLAFELDLFPLGGFVSDDFDDYDFWMKVEDIADHAILPMVAYMAGSFATMTFLMKNSLMDNLAADYVRTAMAKGLSFNQAVRKHAFRNSLIPLATHFGDILPAILGGAFLIETIFNIDGFGLLGYESILERDYPVVLGILVITSVLFLLGNILSDLCVAIVDPRVKFGAKQ